MSHFTVIVVGKDWEKQLIPFQENNMGACPNEYLEFNEYEEKDYKDKGGNIYDDEKPDENNGKYGYWENPNAKWDWYVMGGRWTGFFKLKDGTGGETGQPGLMTAVSRKGYADKCLWCDVDTKTMRKEAIEEATKKYEELEKNLGEPMPKLEFTWEHLLDGKEFKDVSVETKRKLYHAQYGLALAEKKGLSMWDFDRSCMTMTKEQFLQNASDGALRPFAILKDGKWCEEANMGFWGMTSNENKNWPAEANKILDSIKADELVTMVDCHI